LLIMDLMRRIARKHRFKVLFHEQPFAGINGSSKHNNWSMATNTGVNLLAPGKNPKTNLQFLTFLVNALTVVYDYADLIRASVISATNIHRLGSHEAPNTIFSVFLGSQLSKILEEIEEVVEEDKRMTPDEKTSLKLDIGKIPEILLDNTDRNRTSPFAFTGNRFELRAMGASSNCSSSMIVLNAAMSAQLTKFKTEVDELIERDIKKDEAIFQVMRRYIIHSKPVRYEGNTYTDEWIKEAKKRGLTNVANPVDALRAYLSRKATRLFKSTNVLVDKEIRARYEVVLEKFVKKIQIEANVLGDLATNHIQPTAIKYQNFLIENVTRLKNLFDTIEFEGMAGLQIENIKDISNHMILIKQGVADMRQARKLADQQDSSEKKAAAYYTKVLPFFGVIRSHIDALELLVDNEIWPLPKYRELLFTR